MDEALSFVNKPLSFVNELWGLIAETHSWLINAVYNFLSNLTPSPLRQVLPCGNAKSEQVAAQGTGSPTREGEQDLKPLDPSLPDGRLTPTGRGMEAGFQE